MDGDDGLVEVIRTAVKFNCVDGAIDAPSDSIPMDGAHPAVNYAIASVHGVLKSVSEKVPEIKPKHVVGAYDMLNGVGVHEPTLNMVGLHIQYMCHHLSYCDVKFSDDVKKFSEESLKAHQTMVAAGSMIDGFIKSRGKPSKTGLSEELTDGVGANKIDLLAVELQKRNVYRQTINSLRKKI